MSTKNELSIVWERHRRTWLEGLAYSVFWFIIGFMSMVWFFGIHPIVAVIFASWMVRGMHEKSTFLYMGLASEYVVMRWHQVFKELCDSRGKKLQTNQDLLTQTQATGYVNSDVYRRLDGYLKDVSRFTEPVLMFEAMAMVEGTASSPYLVRAIRSHVKSVLREIANGSDSWRFAGGEAKLKQIAKGADRYLKRNAQLG